MGALTQRRFNFSGVAGKSILDEVCENSVAQPTGSESNLGHSDKHGVNDVTSSRSRARSHQAP